MKKIILSLCVVFVTAAKAVSPTYYFFTSTGVISFTSNAPLEIINASSGQLRGLIDESKKTFSFRVSYKTFEGFNSGLQREHFNEKYVESDKYPEAFFNGTINESIDFSKNGTYTISAKGKLSIHGVEKERTIKSNITISNEKIHVESNFNVLLAEYNIHIPKVVTQKIATEIIIDVKADLKRKIMVQ